MTAAYRLKSLGWFGSCAAIVLGFYLVSLQVATERKKLDTVNERIKSAQRDLRALETEFDTRANLAQLERWNGDTLALSAPTAGQFVRDEAQLASLNVTALGNGIEAAALVVPSAPVAAPVIPSAPAAVSQPGAVQVAAATPAPASGVIRASAHLVEPSLSPAAAKAQVASATRAKEAVAKVRPQAVAMLDDKLLSDRTLGDLLTGARSEAGHRR